MPTDAERIIELEERVAHNKLVIEALLVVIEAQANVMLAVANTLNRIH